MGQSLEGIKVGDHIEGRFEGKKHHAIITGKHEVIHLSLKRGRVVVSSIDNFSGIRAIRRPHNANALVIRAKRFSGESGQNFSNDPLSFVSSVFSGQAYAGEVSALDVRLTGVLIGDHITVILDGKEHHVIKTGKHEVVHLSPKRGKVVASSIDNFPGEKRVINRPENPEAVLKGAKACLSVPGQTFSNDPKEFINAVFNGHIDTTSCKADPLEPGDHLVSPRMGSAYDHHGIYIGGNNVIHYSGLAGNASGSEVAITSLKKFSNGNGHYVVPHPNAKFHGDEVVKRARKRLGEDQYNLATNNCEHFVNWCIDDEHRSQQVDRKIWTANGAVVAHVLNGSRLIAPILKGSGSLVAYGMGTAGLVAPTLPLIVVIAAGAVAGYAANRVYDWIRD